MYYYSYSGLTIYIFCLFLFYSKKNLHDERSKIFKYLLWVSMFSCIFDILSSKVIERIDTSPRWLLYLTVYLYYLFQYTIYFMFAAYILTLADKLHRMKLYEKSIFYIPIILSMLTIITNPFTNVIFYINQNGDYCHGPGLIVLLLIGVYYLLYGIIYLFIYRNYITRLITYAIIFYAVIPIIAILFQLKEPSILIANFGIATCELLLLIVLHDTDELLDGETGLFHYDTFLQVLQLKFKNLESFHVTFITLSDQVIINQTFGINYLSTVMSSIGSYLQTKSKLNSCYYLGDGWFAMITDEKTSEESRNELMNLILKRFERKWEIFDTTILLSVRILDIKCPEDAVDINGIIDYIEYIKKDNFIGHQSKYITVKDMKFANNIYRTGVKRMIWENLEIENFQVYFQPIYSTVENRFVSAEAIIRLNDKNPVFVSPEKLIEVSDYNETLIKISENIFEQICQLIQKIKLYQIDIQLIHIDLSIAQCMQEKLIDIFKSTTKKYDISMNQICFEIAETTAGYARNIITKNLSDLDNESAIFLLDKYGEGRSNLAYLLEIPFKYVKLDKNIVNAYFESDKGKILLKSTIAMMKHLNIKIIADEVITLEQVQELTELGVEFLQGKYFSDALSQEELFQLFYKESRL